MTPNTTQKLRQSTHVQARPQNVQDRSPLTKHHCFIGQSAHFTAVPRLNVRNQRSHFRRWLNQTPILGQLEFFVFFLFFLGRVTVVLFRFFSFSFGFIIRFHFRNAITHSTHGNEPLFISNFYSLCNTHDCTSVNVQSAIGLKFQETKQRIQIVQSVLHRSPGQTPPAFAHQCIARFEHARFARTNLVRLVQDHSQPIHVLQSAAVVFPHFLSVFAFPLRISLAIGTSKPDVTSPMMSTTPRLASESNNSLIAPQPWPVCLIFLYKQTRKIAHISQKNITQRCMACVSGRLRWTWMPLWLGRLCWHWFHLVWPTL